MPPEGVQPLSVHAHGLLLRLGSALTWPCWLRSSSASCWPLRLVCKRLRPSSLKGENGASPTACTQQLTPPPYPQPRLGTWLDLLSQTSSLVVCVDVVASWRLCAGSMVQGLHKSTTQLSTLSRTWAAEYKYCSSVGPCCPYPSQQLPEQLPVIKCSYPQELPLLPEAAQTLQELECSWVRHIYRNRPGASPDQPPTSQPSEGLDCISGAWVSEMRSGSRDQLALSPCTLSLS